MFQALKGNLMNPDVSKLFLEKPPTWGLRGDPHLWEAMKTSCQHLPLPATAEAMEQLLGECFYQLVGENLRQGSETYLKSFDHGGMSGGRISHDFWLETAFPLLLSRWQEARQQIKNTTSN
jgi:hypothetical protein